MSLTDRQTVPLTEVLDFREGPGIMARDFRNDGVPLIRLAGLRQQGSLLAGCNYLDPAMVAKRWSQFQLRVGDVLLSTSASLGEVAVVDRSGAGAVPYTGIVAFRPADDQMAPGFIPFALASPSFVTQIEAMGVGSVLRHFGPMHLRQMTVDLPPLPVQRAIAEVLGALDDKIEANRCAVSKAEGLAVVVAGATARRTAVGEVASQSRRLIPITSFADQQVEYFSLPAFDAGRLPLVQDGEAIKSGKFLLERPTVLVSKLNPHIPRVWMAAPTGRTLAVTSTEFVGLVPTADYPVEVLWGLCASAEFTSQLAELVKGTTGSHQRVSAEDMVALKFPDPRALAAGAIETITAAVRLAGGLREESERLSALRDTLLPMLMSGELRVRDADELVGEAV